LESPEVLYLRVIMDVKRESSNVAKGKVDMSSGFGMVERVAKGLFVRKS